MENTIIKSKIHKCTYIILNKRYITATRTRHIRELLDYSLTNNQDNCCLKTKLSTYNLTKNENDYIITLNYIDNDGWGKSYPATTKWIIELKR